MKVSDRDSFLTARAVTRQEGILVGGSCGTAVFAALQVARDLDAYATVVVLLPDTGRGYLSKVYSDSWMLQYGMVERPDVVRVEEVLAAKGGDDAAPHHGRRPRQGPPGGGRPAGARHLPGPGRPRRGRRRDVVRGFDPRP